MAKAKEQPKAQAQRTPVGGFIHHQSKALEETGRALVSLLPKDFRDHAANAVEETKTSWGILFDGVVDTVEGGLQKLRPSPKEDTGKEKVEVE
jgi:hypothetical protein